MYQYFYWSPWIVIHFIFLSSYYLAEFLFMKNCPLKGKVSSITSCSINNSITLLLLSPHTIQYSLRYGIDEVLGIWYDLCWYCWLVFFCWYCWLVFMWVCWRWFGPFWCWNAWPKFRLTMGSIIEWYYVMSISSVYRVSNTY